MKIFLRLVLFISLLSSCSESKPKGILDKRQMASVLIEMYIRESEINEVSVPSDSAGILHQMMLNRTLEKKNIPEETYLKSYDYYINNLKRFEEIYAIVIDSLKLRETLAQQAPSIASETVETDPGIAMIDSLSADSLFTMGPFPQKVDSTLFLLAFDSIPPASETLPPLE